jgi:uncharacterized iron-regulated protein
MNLDIGSKGAIEVRQEMITETRSGRFVSVDNIVEAARGKRFVFVGEDHTSPEAHKWQDAVIRGLINDGRNVIVGLEMYQRPMQPFLDMWSIGYLSEEDFLAKSDWKGQWGFDFALYRPIFETVRNNSLRLVALNIPRDWVRTVGQKGYDSLSAEAKAEVPPLFLGNAEHKKIFTALMGGHPMTDSSHIYEAQVLWDEAMADSVTKYLAKTSVTDKTVFVVLAGNGHVMYRQGINYRIKRRTGKQGITVITAQVEKPTKMSKGLGDFVIGLEPVEAK